MLPTVKDARRTIKTLLLQPVHEHRLAGALSLAYLYEKPKWRSGWIDIHSDAADDEQKVCFSILQFYLAERAGINNWDIVDSSAHKIVGKYLMKYESNSVHSVVEEIRLFPDRPLRTVFFNNLPAWYTDLLFSGQFWDIRIALIALLRIRLISKDFAYLVVQYVMETYNTTEWMIADRPFRDVNLIDKASGWVLRECGGKHGGEDMPSLVEFLRKHHKIMGRVAISYATEKMPRPLPEFLNNNSKKST